MRTDAQNGDAATEKGGGEEVGAPSGAARSDGGFFRLRRYTEMILLFGVIPLAVTLIIDPQNKTKSLFGGTFTYHAPIEVSFGAKWILYTLLAAGTAGSLLWLLRDPSFDRRRLWD